MPSPPPGAVFVIDDSGKYVVAPTLGPIAPIAPTQSNIMAALRSFLISILPSGVVVIVGQDNRVPEPVAGSFVVMTPIRFERIETNVDVSIDTKFVGSIAAETLTVTEFDPDSAGLIALGSMIFGVGVSDRTVVTAFGTGTGGVGTYAVSQNQSVSSETLSAGVETLQQNSKVTVQIDFHSAPLGDAGDMAQIVSTIFRDAVACDQFAGQDPNYEIAPLYADDPRQTPFLNAEQQYEWRWTVEAALQVNQVVVVPQQFADSAVLEVISANASYPP